MQGFKMVRSDEPMAERPLIITLFGQAGVGKTSLAFTMPQPVLFMDFDRGITRAIQDNRPDAFLVDDFGSFYQYVMSPEFEGECKAGGYKTFAIDTVGAMLEDFAASYLIKNDRKNGNSAGGLSLQGWGALGVLFNSMRNRFMQLGLNVCFVAHSKDAGEDAVARMDLAIKGGSSDIVVRVSDQIGFVYMEGQYRVIDFAPSQMHLGKDTGAIGKVQIPASTSMQYGPLLSDIVDKCKAKMFAESSAILEARAKIQAFLSQISELSVPSDFEAFAGVLKEQMPTVQAQLRKPFAERMVASGVIYDKAAKAYYFAQDETPAQ